MLSVRPEHIDLDGRAAESAPPGPDGVNRLRGVVAERTFLGAITDFRVNIGSGLTLRVQGRATEAHRPGDRVAISFTESAAWAVPSGDGAADAADAAVSAAHEPGPVGAG
jgi:hypothetical protein